MILKNDSKIPLDRFINKVLYDKNKGYYMNNNPIGAKGDFITAPNISVMFSEMIAIWLISFWEKIFPNSHSAECLTASLTISCRIFGDRTHQIVNDYKLGILHQKFARQVQDV